jgi:hypothetical protein
VDVGPISGTFVVMSTEAGATRMASSTSVEENMEVCMNRNDGSINQAPGKVQSPVSRPKSTAFCESGSMGFIRSVQAQRYVVEYQMKMVSERKQWHFHS